MYLFSVNTKKYDYYKYKYEYCYLFKRKILKAFYIRKFKSTHNC